MTLTERLSLIRAGYKAAEIKEMEKEVSVQHEQPQMEPGNGMDQQQSAAAAGAEGQNPPETPEAPEQGEPAENGNDPRDDEIAQLKRKIEEMQRDNINRNGAQPYGDDEYIRDVFSRRH